MLAIGSVFVSADVLLGVVSSLLVMLRLKLPLLWVMLVSRIDILADTFVKVSVVLCFVVLNLLVGSLEFWGLHVLLFALCLWLLIMSVFARVLLELCHVVLAAPLYTVVKLATACASVCLCRGVCAASC